MPLLASVPASRQPSRSESQTALAMAEAATAWLASLSADQKGLAVAPLDDAGRFRWDYRPHATRQGLPLKEMDSSQQKLALVLLTSGLSRRGAAKALSIMGLETILKALEGPAGRFVRDPDRYYFTLFGRPGEVATWGWRLEGHHLSLNFLVVAGSRVACLPNFMGANPARVPQGTLTGFRILAPEEELARELLLSLDQPQKGKAIISPEAPADILSQNLPRVEPEAPVGLGFPSLSPPQQQHLLDLIFEYASRLPRDAADDRLNQLEKDGRKHLHFAWAGAEEPGRPHYYRLQGPGLLIEYDNTQNQANHIHTVWRDPRNDWGEDWLRGHRAVSHNRP